MSTKALLMEALGVFSLNYIGAMSITQGYVLTANGAGVAAALDTLRVPLAHMLALGIFIWIGAATSGSHFNPAVTLSLLVTGHTTFMPALLYIVAQCVGSFLGGGLALAFFPNTSDFKDNWTPSTDSPAQYTLGPNFGAGMMWKACMCEFLATFFLVFMVYGCVVDKRAPTGVYGMAIGGTVGMSAVGIGGISGGALNPCRWLGPAVMTLFYATPYPSFVAACVVYTAFPIAGGVAAGLLYTKVLMEDQ